MARITEEQKRQINELYYIYQNKTRVAKELGISIASVTRYLIDGYKPCDKIEEKKCEQKPSYVKLNYDKVNTLLWFTDEELKELDEIRKEITI